MIFSVVGILIIPILWTSIEVPEFMSYVRETPVKVLGLAALCGLIWGISSMLFGKVVRYDWCIADLWRQYGDFSIVGFLDSANSIQ